MTLHVIKQLPEDQLIEQGIEALFNALGPIETTRFLSLLQQQERVESVVRHREWQDNLDPNRFFKEIFGEELVAAEQQRGTK